MAKYSTQPTGESTDADSAALAEHLTHIMKGLDAVVVGTADAEEVAETREHISDVLDQLDAE